MDRLIFKVPVRIATPEEHRKVVHSWRRALREKLLEDARTNATRYVGGYNVGRDGE